MVIAVYADIKTFQSFDPELYFAKSLIKNLATTYTQHTFYLIVPQNLDHFGEQTFPFSLIQLAIKIKTDVLFSIDSILKLPVCQSNLFTSLNRINKYPVARFSQIRSVFVLSEPEKVSLVLRYKIDKQKIKILYGGPSKMFAPLSEVYKLSLKNKYTEGNEYFIYRGLIREQQNIIPLLKGFSIFKKRQRSSMKLMLVGKQVWPLNEFEKIFNTYKYREDVVVVTDVKEEEEAKLVASAYAFIQPYASNSLLFVLDALQCHIPVIIENNSPLKNMFAEGALYFDAADEIAIAEKMMLIYKDEGLRNQLIENGKDISSRYNWQDSIELLWQNLSASGKTY